MCLIPLLNAQTEVSQISGSFDGFFPIALAPERYMGIAFTNTADSEVKVELKALDPRGQLITGADILNPATLVVPPGGQTWASVGDVFGVGILSADLGKISYQSHRAALATLFLIGDEKNILLDGGTAGQRPLKAFVLPSISREGESPFTTVHLFNPSVDSDLEVELTLYDLSGKVMGSKTVALSPQGTVAQDLAALFEAELGMFSGGYVRGVAGGDGVVALETFGNEQSLNLLSAQKPFRDWSYQIPHFAVGGGFDTELNLINTDSSKAVTLRVSALDDEGNVRLSPVQISLGPREQGIFNISSLFGLPSDEQIVGSLRIDLEDRLLDSSLDLTTVNGSIRLRSSDGRLSASLPLLLPRDADAFYAHVAQDLGFFTGVAVLNPQRNPVEVTVEAFDQLGDQVGESVFTLPAGGRKAKLLLELIPATTGQVGGYFRVRSEDEIVSFVLFGDLAGESISTIPSQ